MNKFLIKIQNLTKQFENNNSVIKVLKDVNLNLESGKIIALVGPSGSGKSTLLQIASLLGGECHRTQTLNSEGISSKKIIIEYNISLRPSVHPSVPLFLKNYSADQAETRYEPMLC